MNSQRMQAEQVRDSILYLSGKLDFSPGGPSIDPLKSDRVFRRSVYFRQTLDRGDRMLRAFDSADPNECYRRVESIVPQQALVMANSRLTFEHARLMAKSLTENTNAEDGAFVQAAFARTLGRPPGREEAEACAAYLVSRRAPRADNADENVLGEEKKPIIAASTDPAQRARESLVQVLLNHTDFVTIH